jgi:hypothetical protein
MAGNIKNVLLLFDCRSDGKFPVFRQPYGLQKIVTAPTAALEKASFDTIPSSA